MMGRGGVVWMDMAGMVGAYSTHRLDHSPTVPAISLTWVLRNGARPPVKADKRGRLEGQESRQHAHLVLRRIKSALRVVSGTGEARAPLASPGQRGSRLMKPWWPR